MDARGQKQIYGGGQYWRWLPCINAPGFEAYLKKVREAYRKVNVVKPARLLELFVAPYHTYLLETLKEAIRPDVSEGEEPEVPILERSHRRELGAPDRGSHEDARLTGRLGERAVGAGQGAVLLHQPTRRTRP